MDLKIRKVHLVASFYALAFAMISTKLQNPRILFSVARYLLHVISLVLTLEWHLVIAPSCGSGRQLLAELRAPKARARSTMGKKIWLLICARKFGFGHRTTVRPYDNTTVRPSTPPCMPMWPVSPDHIEAILHADTADTRASLHRTALILDILVMVN